MHLCISFCVCMRVCARVCEVRGARCADLWIWRSDEIFIMHELCLGWEQLCINQGSPNSSLLELCSVLFSEFCSFITAPPKEKKKKPTEREKCVRMPLWTKEPDSFSCFKGGKRVRNLPWHRSSQQPVFIPDSPCSIQIIWGEKLKSPPSQNDILHLHRMRTAWFNRTWFVASKA